jgi:hypothetical protein
METAIFGLIGVVVGAFLTIIKEWWFKDREHKKNGEYLAILITSMLERYVAECAEVVSDDGLYHGQPNSNGNRETHTTPPSFKPLSVQVEWKSLPANLMNDVLSFPLEIESANAKIDSVSEYVATPPDYEEFFEERQYQHALLGIRASKLSALLRTHASLPARAIGEWNPIECMQTRLAEIEHGRAEHVKRRALSMESLRSSQDEL